MKRESLTCLVAVGMFCFALRLAAAAPPQEIAVRGNGVTVVNGDRTPTYVDHTRFEAVPVSESSERTYIVHNIGYYPLLLTGGPPVAVSGPHAGDFTIAAQPTNEVAVGSNATFTVRFSPSAAGRRVAVLAIPSNDPNTSLFTFSVEGAGRKGLVFEAAYSLAALDGMSGFRLDGIDASDSSGSAVSGAGDVNGDGYADVVIGARRADPGGDSSAGETYVVFGKADGWSAAMDLSALDGTNGFRLDGVDASDYSGCSVRGVGDFNGDGYADLIVGAYGADPGAVSSAGESYMFFGRAGGWPAALDLSTLSGADGFRLDGIADGDRSGYSVGGAGDVNGDGLQDVIVGAYYADPGGDSMAGESYVVFGRAGGWAAALDLSTLDGANGFRLEGIDPNDLSGCSVSGAGDVNGDGYGDLIVGAARAAAGGDNLAGESYVVFGKARGLGRRIGPVGARRHQRVSDGRNRCRRRCRLFRQRSGGPQRRRL